MGRCLFFRPFTLIFFTAERKGEGKECGGQHTWGRFSFSVLYTAHMKSFFSLVQFLFFQFFLMCLGKDMPAIECIRRSYHQGFGWSFDPPLINR